MRAMFSLVSLLLVVAAVAYLYSSQPALQPQTQVGGSSYQSIEAKAKAAGASMQKDPQAQLDSATNPPAATPPTSGN